MAKLLRRQRVLPSPMPSLLLMFPDLGAGQANLTPQIGSGSATFTRSSTATTIDGTGTIVSVATNVARSYYNPTTLAYEGFLHEPARTNNLTQSQTLDNVAWTKTASTVTADTAVAPDGTTTADKIVEDSTTAYHLATGTSGALLNTTAYTASVYVKAAGDGFVLVKAAGIALSASNNFFVTVDLSSGAMPFTGSSGVYTVTAMPNSWYRVCIRFTTTAAGTLQLQLFTSKTASNNPTYLGDGVNGIFAWGAQVEDGVGESTYIPTVGSTVARSAEFLFYDFTGNMTESVGSAAAVFRTVESANGLNQFLVSASDNTYNNRIVSGYLSATANGGVFTVGGGTADGGATVPGGGMPDGAFKIACAWAANDLAATGTSRTVGVDTTWTIPAGLTKINIGSDHLAANALNGTIAQVAVYPVRLRDDVLQRRTK